MVKKTIKTKSRKKKLKNVPKGIVHIHSTFSNTIVTITDMQGNALTWASSGSIGYKGTKKSTPFAAQLAAESATKAAKEYGLTEVIIQVKGAGQGRESAIRSVQACGVMVKAIKDVSGVPHNGCRPPKLRRI